jgi:Asp-tRNA(Asn)/Glu-tRNA(Gln) amidotransferase A subunit family amidase
MSGNGYEKPVLVTTDWLAEHAADAGVVVAEVDENPDLYEEGHIPGAVKLHWRDDLQDPVRRDLVDRADFERLLGERGIGNDVVSPSRRNGLSALRPTYGRVSRHGGMVLSWSMDKPGPMCRSIEDCAHVFHVIHGADEKDPSTLTAPFRFTRTPDFSALSIGFTEDAPESFLEHLASLGARLTPMPPLPEGGSNAITVEGAAAFEFHVAPNGEPEPLPEGLEQSEVRRRTRFTRGREISGVEYLQSQRRRYLLMQEMAEAMEGFDMFVSGSGETGLTNATGHPAVVVPYDFGVRDADADSPTEMPLTTIIVGDLFADDRILSVAHAYQSTTDWHLRHPSLS